MIEIDVKTGKLLDDNVGGAWAALELLAAAGCVAALAEDQGQLALSNLASSSRPSTYHALPGSDVRAASLVQQALSVICHGFSTVTPEKCGKNRSPLEVESSVK